MVANGIMTDESKLLLRPHPSDKSGYYSRALQLLESMEAAPSCNRIVANNLLSSCKGIEGSPTHQEAALDDTKSVYAAQLAMCEIASTGVAIPSECKLLTPPSDKEGLKQLSGPNAAKFGGAMKIYSRHLRQCLKALESRPQWWTSYSNSRQNTVLLCQAVRIDIERGTVISSLYG